MKRTNKHVSCWDKDKRDSGTSVILETVFVIIMEIIQKEKKIWRTAILMHG